MRYIPISDYSSAIWATPQVLIVAGTLESHVKADFVIITDTGLLKGDAECRFLFAAGTLSGKVDVSGLARFQAGSTMSGQLSCPSVVVEQGAFLDCDIASLPAGVSGFQHLLLRLRAYRLIKRMAKLELARPPAPDDVHLNAAA